MAESLDYYRVIDVSPQATPSEIKAAYHRAAKRAHPDAGGSLPVMQSVNEAYAVLRDPAERRAYDRRRHEAANDQTRQPEPAAPAHRPDQQGAVYHAHVHPSAAVLARHSAWRIIGYSLVAAVALGTVAPFLFDRTPDRPSKIILSLTAFLPIYCLAVGVVFLFKPRLRIALAHLGAARLPPMSDLLALFGVGLAAVPLAAVWVIGFFIGVIR